MQTQGIITAVLPVKEGTSSSGKEWAMLDFVLEVPGQYPRHICLNIFGNDRIQQLAPRVGDTVTVDFDIDAHEYQGRWYNRLRAWNLTRVSDAQPTAQPATSPWTPQPQDGAQPTAAASPAAPWAQPPAAELPF